MLSVHLEKGQVEIVRRPSPRRRDGHALIRLLCAGICNTDLELLRGYYNFQGTPGHEFVGEVVEADDRTLLGRRVVGEINLACGQCHWCRKGLGRHCPRRTVLGIEKHPGVFSEFFTLPEENLHLVPDSTATEHAVFTEPLAAACEILDQVHIPQGIPIAVLGDGKLGLLVAQVFHANRLEVHLYGKHPKKLAVAASAGVNSRRISSRQPSAVYDWTVEATGSPQGLTQAVRMTKPQGTVILKSTIHGAVTLDMAQVVVNEITLVGSRCGRFPPALQLLDSGQIQVESMISARMPLSKAPQAFAAAARKGVLKVLLEGS